ncbi:hypothetical protein Taro_027047 [Colocasia esculenta]|uniref:Retrotransposon gag domain-containing protein n=1 Tax=Colocasia esculenta TaxID=4460 RepID=A0A843VLD3_COLES|nr:hypothetical protein [Colocasia esculenta]
MFLCVYTDCGLVSLARLRPVRGRWTRIKYVIGLTGLAEAFRPSWYQSKKFLVWLIEEIGVVEEMIRRRAPVPPVVVPPGDGEVVPVALVPPRVEVPFAAPVPPPPPVLIAEEPVMQVEKFLRLQPPTYSGGLNPDTAEHWVHEIERVFVTMRCPAADRVVLAAYQLRGFALEWWRLKMQTTFAGRTEEAITWSEFLDWKFGYVNCEIFIKCGMFLCVYTDCGLVSLARLRPVRGRRTRIKYVIGLTGLAEEFHHRGAPRYGRGDADSDGGCNSTGGGGRSGSGDGGRGGCAGRETSGRTLWSGSSATR